MHWLQLTLPGNLWKMLHPAPPSLPSRRSSPPQGALAVPRGHPVLQVTGSFSGEHRFTPRGRGASQALRLV